MEYPVSDDRWHQFSAEILSGMHEWRQQHPRARLLADLALKRAAAWAATLHAEQPTCPSCATPLHERGTQPRFLQTHVAQTLT